MVSEFAEYTGRLLRRLRSKKQGNGISRSKGIGIVVDPASEFISWKAHKLRPATQTERSAREIALIVSSRENAVHEQTRTATNSKNSVSRFIGFGFKQYSDSA